MPLCWVKAVSPWGHTQSPQPALGTARAVSAKSQLCNVSSAVQELQRIPLSPQNSCSEKLIRWTLVWTETKWKRKVWGRSAPGQRCSRHWNGVLKHEINSINLWVCVILHQHFQHTLSPSREWWGAGSAATFCLQFVLWQSWVMHNVYFVKLNKVCPLIAPQNKMRIVQVKKNQVTSAGPFNSNSSFIV